MLAVHFVYVRDHACLCFVCGVMCSCGVAQVNDERQRPGSQDRVPEGKEVFVWGQAVLALTQLLDKVCLLLLCVVITLNTMQQLKIKLAL